MASTSSKILPIFKKKSTDQGETLSGTDQDDTIFGRGGNDRIYGYGGNDTLYGNAGNDVLDGGSDSGNDSDSIKGGNGDDVIVARTGSGNSHFNGGPGNDTLNYHESSTVDESYASLLSIAVDVNLSTGIAHKIGRGTDMLTSIENVIGTKGHDKLTGNADNNMLRGWSGNDTLLGEAGDDTLYGDNGNDLLEGGKGDDALYPGSGNDIVYGGAGEDTADYSTANPGDGYGVIVDLAQNTATKSGKRYRDQLRDIENVTGNSQDDQLAGNAGNNVLDGNGGNDILVGRAGNDQLMGGVGNDTLSGDADNDVLMGGDGNDTLRGGDGNDALIGGAGNDDLYGGTGSDTYLLGREGREERISEWGYINGQPPENTAKWASDVTFDQLWWTREDNDLLVNIVGTRTEARFADWYLGTAHQGMAFKAGDGKTLSNAKLDGLVQAMAGLLIPPQGQTALSDDYRRALLPVLASSWVPA